MVDLVPAVPTKGRLIATPWVAIVGHAMRQRLTARVDLETKGFVYAVRFENGWPTGLFGGELDSDTPVSPRVLLDKLVELATLAGDTTYALHEGKDAIASVGGARPMPCEPLTLVLRAIAVAPPRAQAQQPTLSGTDPTIRQNSRQCARKFARLRPSFRPRTRCDRSTPPPADPALPASTAFESVTHLEAEALAPALTNRFEPHF